MGSVILIGPPGAGKGTQREKIAEEFNMSSIVPGDLMREEIKNKTGIGLKLIDYVNKGLLAPHELAMEVVEKAILNYKKKGIKNLLFDGFPREIEQADALDKIIERNNEFKIKSVIFFRVSDEEVIKRIKKRGITSGRADDADEKIIKTRLEVFHKKIQVVIDKYKKLNLLDEINGEGDVEEIHRNVEFILRKILN